MPSRKQPEAHVCIDEMLCSQVRVLGDVRPWFGRTSAERHKTATQQLNF